MHIGCCENCKYIDLVENVTGICPRCGSAIISTGIDSSEWNRMSDEERKKVLPGSVERSSADVDGDVSKEEENEPEVTFGSYQEQQIPPTFEYVYVCYKCSSLAGHSEPEGRYYCGECGSDMVPVKMSTDKWALLGKEEKRRLIEKTRIDHMVSAIKESGVDEGDNDKISSVINVVK